MFNIVTGINESNTLTKHIPCKCKCRFHLIKFSSNQWWNNYRCRCERKKYHICDHVIVKMESI